MSIEAVNKPVSIQELKDRTVALVRSMIKSPAIAEWTVYKMLNAPSPFWTDSASSTGKYHPASSQGPHSLLKHTIAVAKLVETMGEIGFFELSSVKIDRMISGAFLHDIIKRGYGPDFSHTVSDHAALGADYALRTDDGCPELRGDHVKIIAGIIRAHMGKWGSNMPGTREQALVSLADMISSRKYCNFDYVAAGCDVLK